ncbi:MAG TPA: TetR/AcrR family transcriptional regulator, partial [Geminicoccaceae bacterium]|nr:TetR/AcrR family transcriptional regulator [Geminicoccaceae bacterium]
MRDRIKGVAAELLIRHGYRGLRFGDIAARLGTTRANVHYHFGTKERLVEEVVDDYLRVTLDRFRAVWLDGGASLYDKIRGTMEFNRERYRRFNRRGAGAKPWSLIARMRLERDLLTDRTNAGLRNFAVELESFVTAAVELAKERGELTPDAPVRDIALQLVCIANSAGSITQDTGGFGELEQLYLGFARIVTHAYG